MGTKFLAGHSTDSRLNTPPVSLRKRKPHPESSRLRGRLQALTHLGVHWGAIQGWRPVGPSLHSPSASLLERRLYAHLALIFVTAAKATPLDRLDLAASGFCCSPAGLRASLVAQVLRSLSAVQETQVWSPGWGDPLKKVTATHNTILAWRIPWTDKPGGLQSTGSQSQTRLSA